MIQHDAPDPPTRNNNNNVLRSLLGYPCSPIDFTPLSVAERLIRAKDEQTGEAMTEHQQVCVTIAVLERASTSMNVAKRYTSRHLSLLDSCFSWLVDIWHRFEERERERREAEQVFFYKGFSSPLSLPLALFTSSFLPSLSFLFLEAE